MRVFRRPMFRRGGTTNQGIMTGLVDRRRYDMGAFGTKAKEYATDIQSIMGKPDINQLLIQGGLGLVGGQGTGQGALADVASAFQKPTAQYFQQAMTNKMASKKLGVEMAMKERLAKQKAMAGAGFLKREPVERVYENMIQERTKQLADLPQYMLSSGKIPMKLKYIEASSEYDSKVVRALEATDHPVGKMINAKKLGYVNYNPDTGQFVGLSQLPVPGAFYYYPPLRAFVQRIPGNKNKNIPEKYYKYDKYTYKKTEITKDNPTGQ